MRDTARPVRRKTLSLPGRRAVGRLLAPARRRLDALSTGGLAVGLVVFALSLTPSLIPRHFVHQGILSGCVFAAGYGVGVFVEWLLGYLGFALSERRTGRLVRRVLVIAGLALAVLFLWQSTGWQNAIRAGMGLAPVESHQPVRVAAIALAPAALLIGAGTLVVHGVRAVSRRLARVLPPRAALVAGMLVVALLSALLVNGVLVRSVLYVADNFYAELDQLAGSEAPAPLDPLRSGSAASLVEWDTIGLDARAYVETGPGPAEIAAITGRPALTPLRVYVGLRSAGSVEARAALALAEMQRVGAFSRSVLVLVMPVGTGWVDPASIDTLEILHGGDVASVALQYSYLTSWLSLVTEPDVGVAAAQALFNAVYAYWRELPETGRPRLYLHGLSLGAYSSQASATLYDILDDPFHGALWVGPPFASETWRAVTAGRAAGSPWWLPRIGDGSAVRFANHGGPPAEGFARWGRVRILYIQYPSDPIVFFEPAILYRPPEWLVGARGPGVSAQLNWYPLVTFFQVALDLALAQTAPIGFGHVYAPTDYLDAWAALTDPPGVGADDLAKLRETLARHGDRHAIDPGWFRD